MRSFVHGHLLFTDSDIYHLDSFNYFRQGNNRVKTLQKGWSELIKSLELSSLFCLYFRHVQESSAQFNSSCILMHMSVYLKRTKMLYSLRSLVNL